MRPPEVKPRRVRRAQPATALTGCILLAGLWGGPGVLAAEVRGAESGAEEPTVGASGVTTSVTRRFVFERLNREYENEVVQPIPRERGSIRLRLTSPQNRVRLVEHELRLTPLSDGSHRAALTVEFEGGAEVEAEISVAGAASRVEDRVTVPLQRRTLDGRVTIERVAGGYVFTAVELPERVAVTIESHLADRFLQTCNLLRALVPLECNGLGALLSRVVLPLPDPGGAYLLPDRELTVEDRAALDGYLRSGP